MAASGYTPIILFNSGTASNVPTTGNLAVGELAINYADGKLYYNTGSAIKVLAGSGGAGVVAGSNTQVQYNSSGAFGASANFTFSSNVLGLGTAGVGALFQGDFSNATLASRTAFQTGTANATTGIYALPNGTSTAASWQATNAADPTNASKILIATNGSTDVQLVSGRNGTGTYLPLSFYTNGSQQAQLDTSGNFTLSNGNITLSAGTANGVAYLNGSKVLTTGSALTFDGTNLGVGASGSYRLNIQNSASGDIARFSDGVAQTLIIGTTGSGIYYNNANSGYQAWLSGGSEQMRLTSTGLGIGTSSPAARLQVQDATANNGTMQLGGTTYYGTIKHNATGTGANEYNVASASGGGHQFLRGGTLQFMTDASGNLGLGVTPSAWGSGQIAMDIGLGSAIWNPGTATQTQILNNSYFNNTNFIFKGTGYASRYRMTGAQHEWYSSTASGSASGTIIFNQAMTLGSDGTLGVGTTGAVAADGTFVAAGSNGTGQGAANTVAQANFWETTSGNKAGLWFGAMTNSNVGVIGSRTSSGAIAFQTYNSGWAERARIDSSGNLLVGQTGTALQNSNSIALMQGTTGYVVVNHFNGTASGTAYASFGYNASAIGSITQSGTTAVLYNVTSDQRLKTNISDAESASSLIDAIQVRQYDWKSDGSHQRYGFIAQELVTVAPEAVHQPADPDEMMAVDYSKLVPMLVKEIQSLRARLKAANIA